MITGSGSFDRSEPSINGGGSYTILDTGGSVVGSGTWTAMKFDSFTSTAPGGNPGEGGHLELEASFNGSGTGALKGTQHTEVFKSNGYSTIHLMFAEQTPKELIGQCIRVLLQKGATYRRSGLRAFSINIPPEADRSGITGYLEQLKQAGMFSDENHDSIGAAEQARRHLDYLMGKRPKLQDGHVPETELDLSSSDQSKPA